ncbi:MAG: AAA family ATPase [Methanobacteriaceae archaeon]
MKFQNVSFDKSISENRVLNNLKDVIKESKVIVIEGIGYPFLCNLIENPKIEVKDKELFEIYAKDQWQGFIATEGSYLFDQKMLPDYGFKVLKAYPNNSTIGENTSIVLIENETGSIINKFSQAVTSENGIKVNDVIGQEIAKSKFKVISKYLENPDEFGKWAPRNILFYGTPGTGKTMVAKSLSNELEVPLYLIKATTLIGDHVGDGARQIHDLFEVAKKTTPSVIFIDEIDAIALHRSFQSLRGDVSEVVNALLTEMDGISENKGVVTIAATNNPEQLDYAIRSRFEEEIEFVLPNEKEREEIIKINIASMPIGINVSSKNLAKLSKGMSGRDIVEKFLKTSLHNAISNDDTVIGNKHIEYALKNYKKEKNEPKNMFA